MMFYNFLNEVASYGFFIIGFVYRAYQVLAFVTASRQSSNMWTAWVRRQGVLSQGRPEGKDHSPEHSVLAGCPFFLF
jgi:hypothetical protein